MKMKAFLHAAEVAKAKHGLELNAEVFSLAVKAARENFAEAEKANESVHWQAGVQAVREEKARRLHPTDSPGPARLRAMFRIGKRA